MNSIENKRKLLRKLIKEGNRIKLVYVGNSTGAKPIEFETKPDSLGFRENLRNNGFGYYLRSQGNQVPLRAVRGVFYSPLEDCFHINLDWNYVYFHKPHADLHERVTNDIQQVMEELRWA